MIRRIFRWISRHLFHRGHRNLQETHFEREYFYEKSGPPRPRAGIVLSERARRRRRNRASRLSRSHPHNRHQPKSQ